MKIIGIVGHTASGKSLLAQTFKKHHCVVFDADKQVHRLYRQNQQVITFIKNNFTDCVSNGTINRNILRQYLIDHKYKLALLEEFIHPIIAKTLIEFIKFHNRIKTQYVILDIPLLFEIKAQYLCDILVFIHTNDVLRKARIAARYQGEKAIFSLLEAHQDNKITKNYKFKINSGIEKCNMVYNVIRLLKQASRIESRKNNLSLYCSQSTSLLC